MRSRRSGSAWRWFPDVKSRGHFILALLAAGLAAAGCVSTGTGAKWYAPATWFSGAPAAAADKASAKQDAAREAAVKAAQRAAHETGEALGL